jgi:hypothetical protein
MPPSAAEAADERADALADIQEDGAPVLVRFDRNWNVGSGRERPAEDFVDVQTYALFDTAKAGDVDGKTILTGDAIIWLADAGLDSLEGLADLPLGGEPARSGYELLENDPTAFPTPGDPDNRRYELLQVLDTVRVGGWSVLHKIHARG